MHLTKSDTVLKMAALGRLDWYATTHTCYEGLDPHVGNAQRAKLRLNGFKDAGNWGPPWITTHTKVRF